MKRVIIAVVVLLSWSAVAQDRAEAFGTLTFGDSHQDVESKLQKAPFHSLEVQIDGQLFSISTKFHRDKLWGIVLVGDGVDVRSINGTLQKRYGPPGRIVDPEESKFVGYAAWCRGVISNPFNQPYSESSMHDCEEYAEWRMTNKRIVTSACWSAVRNETRGIADDLADWWNEREKPDGALMDPQDYVCHFRTEVAISDPKVMAELEAMRAHEDRETERRREQDSLFR